MAITESIAIHGTPCDTTNLSEAARNRMINILVAGPLNFFRLDLR